MNINTIKADLSARGFYPDYNGKMIFAEGSISNYRKCTISLDFALWGDIAEEHFYLVRYESFAESGQPEVDHHTITERYIAESQIAEFCREKYIETAEERRARRAEYRAKLLAGREQKRG